jgi:hypothetical protein
MADQFGPRFRLQRKSQGSFTCRKSATWDRRLYYPSEGRHAVDFFARKIRLLWPCSNPRSWVPEASTLTTRPTKPHTCTSLFIGGPCRKRADDLPKLSTHRVKMAVAILTGHAPVRKHLRTVGLFEGDPTCRFCR